MYKFYKKWLGYILGYFLTNSSGHPGPDAPYIHWYLPLTEINFLRSSHTIENQYLFLCYFFRWRVL
jgi:hypothetical protein